MTAYVTATIQIGNSDNKLTQKEWSEYAKRVDREIKAHAKEVHFSGSSDGIQPFQNACWVINIGSPVSKLLMDRLKLIRRGFRQNSIAYTEGNSEMI